MQEGRSNKSKLVFGIALLAVGIALLVWAVTGRNAEAPASESTAPSGTSQQTPVENPDEPVSNDQSETAVIVFTDDGFSPEELEVKVGTVVTVRNDSAGRVQFSSDDHPTHLENQGMNLRILNSGESATFTANEVGEWGFHDHLDDSHAGSLTVTE